MIDHSDFLTDLIHNYGLLGLFFTSFLSSTIFFPIPAEPFIFLVNSIEKNPYLIVFIATLGSLLGTSLNYYIGFLGAKAIKKRVSKEKLEEARRLTNKYGWPGLLFIIAIPIPGIPVDPITIFPGIARMNFFLFAIVVFFGKLIKYSIVLGVFNLII